MQHCAEIRELETARVALNPARVQILDRLREPKTCAELAAELGHSPQRVNNHVRELLRCGLVVVTRRRRVKNFTEATYQAVAKVFVLSPWLVRPEVARERDELSLHNLLATAASIQEDVTALLQRTEEEEVPSLAFDVDIHLRSAEERSAFARDALAALRPVVERYQGAPAPEHAYRFRVVCYPSPRTKP
jgi:DNA-binding transcriptional ArsR family regulator